MDIFKKNQSGTDLESERFFGHKNTLKMHIEGINFIIFTAQIYNALQMRRKKCDFCHLGEHGILVAPYKSAYATRTLVYRDKISSLWVKGFPSNQGVEDEYPPKRRYFAAIGSYSVKTVADRHRHAAYHNKHCNELFRFININALERP